MLPMSRPRRLLPWKQEIALDYYPLLRRTRLRHHQADYRPNQEPSDQECSPVKTLTTILQSKEKIASHLPQDIFTHNHADISNTSIHISPWFGPGIPMTAISPDRSSSGRWSLLRVADTQRMRVFFNSWLKRYPQMSGLEQLNPHSD